MPFQTGNVVRNENRRPRLTGASTLPIPSTIFYDGWIGLQSKYQSSHYKIKRFSNLPSVGYRAPSSYIVPTYSQPKYVSFDDAPEPIYGMVTRTRKSNDCRYTEEECNKLEREGKVVQCEIPRFRLSYLTIYPNNYINNFLKTPGVYMPK